MTALSDFILERLNTLVVVVNSQGVVNYVSPSVKNVLGFDAEMLYGEAWYNLTRKDASEVIKVKNDVTKLLASDAVFTSFERQLFSASGEPKWILWNSSKGPENTLVSVGYDITERKLAEAELVLKNKELEQKNHEMLESLEYAQNIQQAILPSIDILNETFAGAFVLYKPRDIVSGDFYFWYKRDNKVFVAAVDCTGHGVPGALMSVIGHSLLKEIIVKKRIEEPSEILNALDEELYAAINRTGKPVTNDGMDVALGVFDLEKNKLSYSGAFRTLFFTRNGKVEEIKGGRYPIGFYQDVKKEFITEEILLEQGDNFYFLSDGYVDQFGGEDNKKLNRKRFREVLLSIADMEAEEQEGYLEYVINNWKQDTEQTDDILVVGVKI
jgi:PAS domain S-box-containing protein